MWEVLSTNVFLQKQGHWKTPDKLKGRGVKDEEGMKQVRAECNEYCLDSRTVPSLLTIHEDYGNTFKQHPCLDSLLARISPPHATPGLRTTRVERLTSIFISTCTEGLREEREQDCVWNNYKF